MKFKIFLLLLNFGLGTYGQTLLQEAPKGDDILNYANFMSRRNPLGDMMFAEVRNRNIVFDPSTVGSPYFNEEFQPCELYYKKDFAEKLYYRYNMHNDEVELKESLLSETVFALNLDRNITLKAEDLILSLETLNTPKQGVRNGYVNVLYSGKNLKVYERVKTKFKEGVRAVNSMVRSTPDKFNQFIEYYYQVNDERLLQYLPNKRRKIIEALPKDYQIKATDLIKKNRYGFKSREGLLQFITDLDN
jgi:hypothetical protein